MTLHARGLYAAAPRLSRLLVCLATLTLTVGLAGAGLVHANPNGDSHSNAHTGNAGHQSGHGDPTEHFNWTDTGYADKDMEGGTLEPGEHSMSPPMMLMLVNFAIVLILVGWKIAPAIQGYVVNRHRTIKQALEEAAELRAQAERKLAEYGKKLQAADDELKELVAEIRRDAEAEKERIIADAEAMAESMKRDAESRIAAEIARVRHEIRTEVVAVAVAAAETLIREHASTDDQSKLFTAFMNDMITDNRHTTGERA